MRTSSPDSSVQPSASRLKMMSQDVHLKTLKETNQAMIDGEPNVELRRVMLERFGVANYMQEGNCEIVHEDEWGTLLRRSFGSDEPVMVLRVINSTPDADGNYKRYLLRVPPNMRTAKQAVAWTFQMEEFAYNPRQES